MHATPGPSRDVPRPGGCSLLAGIGPRPRQMGWNTNPWARKRVAIHGCWPSVGVRRALLEELLSFTGVAAVILEADARWMRWICIAVSASRRISGGTGVFVPCRGSSPPQFSSCLMETIHPHTCICNEIISLPPWALITQAQHLDRPQSCTGGPGCRKERAGGGAEKVQ